MVEYNEKRFEIVCEHFHKYNGFTIFSSTLSKKTIVGLFMRYWEGEPRCRCQSSICVCERQKYNDFLSKTTPKEFDELFNKIHTSFSLFTLLRLATRYINTFTYNVHKTSEESNEYNFVKSEYIPYLYDLLDIQSKQQCDKIEKQQLEINKLNKRLIRLEKKQKDTDDWIEDIEDELENKPKVKIQNLLDI